MRHAHLLLVILLGASAAALDVKPAKEKQDALSQPPRVSEDANDWPMYNRDVNGTRHHPAEKSLSRENVTRLVEKWRFPPRDSRQKIGVVHATVVVNGYVYFGTETMPSVYKLTPDGKAKWIYPPRKEARADEAKPKGEGLPV